MSATSGQHPLGDAPALVHVTRGGVVESVHHARLVVTGPDGRATIEHGAVAEPVLPRSCLKPVQALAMVRLGLDVPPHLLALVCASHSAEPAHREGVAAVLDRAGLTPDDLGNAPELPLGEVERARWIAAGRGPEPIAQDCSGKHAGMLLTCHLRGWPTTGYLDPDHPLQQAIRDTVAERCGPVTTTTVDGCGAPLFAVPLIGVARAFGALASATDGPERTVADAMRAAPEMVGGEGRDVTAMMRALPGVLAKDGAESVYAAGTPDGPGIALKVVDGAPTPRARVALLVAALRTSGHDSPGLAALADQPVLGGGRPVGDVTALDLSEDHG